MKESKFIVFEGIDGAGKSTQIRLLGEYLESVGIKTAISAEPTTYPTGRAIRDVLSGKVKVTDDELAVMFATDRANHNTNPDNGIASCLSSGVTVISDRYYYSSMAYQGVQIGLERVMQLNLENPDIRRPDLCIFLDLTPEDSLARINAREGESEIFETYEYLEKTRNTFYNVINLMRERGENIVCIDASSTIEEISRAVIAAASTLWES